MFACKDDVDEIRHDRSSPCGILVGPLWQVLSCCSLTRVSFQFFGLDLDQRLRRNENIASNTEMAYLCGS